MSSTCLLPTQRCIGICCVGSLSSSRVCLLVSGSVFQPYMHPFLGICKQTDRPCKAPLCSLVEVPSVCGTEYLAHDFRSRMKRELIASIGGCHMGRKSPGTMLSSHELKILHKPLGDNMWFSFHLALTVRGLLLSLLSRDTWLGFLY